MAKIPQKSIFSWNDIDEAGELDRLRLVLEAIPDEALMRELEARRGNGRDDYPIRPIWNSILAGVVFQHESIASLRRELKRNGQLRDECGFYPLRGAEAVPSDRAYSHFISNLLDCLPSLESMFDELVDELEKELPDFGSKCAVDSKAIKSLGKPTGKDDGDRRRDSDADWGTKKQKGKKKDGSNWEKVKSWFGYKLHLLVDSVYELPVAFDVTRASASDTSNLLPLLEKTQERHPELTERAEELSADRGYDSAQNNTELFDKFGIKPVIDIRNCWGEGEHEKGEIKTRALFEDRADQIVYDFRGTVYCHCPATDERREMAFMGFEQDRMTLKYRCPAVAYGFECAGRSICGGGKFTDFGRVVRIPLEKDRRIFTPIARSSYAWDREYKHRTAVERVNSRLDVSFNFERHYIRGLGKMKARVGLALVVMLAMALGRIRADQREQMRSLVKPVKRKAA